MTRSKVFQGALISGQKEEVFYRGRVYTLYKEGFVYFATFNIGPETLVKIGWSQNPWARVVELGIQFRKKITVRHTVDIPRGSRLWGTGYGSLERRLHDDLARFRVDPYTEEPTGRGEWYALSPEQVIETVRYGKSLVESEPAK